MYKVLCINVLVSRTICVHMSDNRGKKLIDLISLNYRIYLFVWHSLYYFQDIINEYIKFNNTCIFYNFINDDQINKKMIMLKKVHSKQRYMYTLQAHHLPFILETDNQTKKTEFVFLTQSKITTEYYYTCKQIIWPTK